MTEKIALNDIAFPVYQLGNKPPITEDGVSYYLYQSRETGEYLKAIVDDKAMPGSGLASRRMFMMRDKTIKLYKIRRAIFFLSDMMKITRLGKWFIDTQGKIFEYKKTTRVRLIYRPISRVIHTGSGSSVIEVKGIASRFKTLYPPKLEEKYAGLLVFGASYILYGLYDKAYEESYRVL